MILISQGVPQTFDGHATATTLRGRARRRSRAARSRSQIAIKQLGTNGGGFYNSNSAVPFENPNGLTNFLEMLSILLIPAAQVFMFGRMVLARRHAWMVFAAMFAVFAIGVAVALPAEQHGSQVLRASGVNITQGDGQSGRQHGRQGGPLRHRQHGALGDRDDATPRTARSTAATTRSRPPAAPCPLVNIFLGEVIFGGVGSGLYGMFFYIVIAVFVAGLMVGPHARVARARRSRRARSSSPRSARSSCRRWCSSLTALSIVTDVRARVDLQPRRPRLHRGALRLRLAGEQQRQRVRRLRRDELLGRRSARSRCYLGRFVPLLAALALGGVARAEEDRAGLGRDVPHRRRRRSSCCSSA